VDTKKMLLTRLRNGVVATLKQLKMGFFCIFGFSNQRNTIEKSVKSLNKSTYKILNWKEHNASLQKRGKITLWIDAEMLRKWNEVDVRKIIVGEKKYTELYNTFSSFGLKIKSGSFWSI
jgi:hypothetical protein